MNVDIAGVILRGLLGGRRKRSRNAARFLGRGGSVINANTLMAAAGLAWGAYEAWQAKAGSGHAVSPQSPPPPAVSSLAGVPAPSTSQLRMLRLAVAAANSDGAMSETERVAVIAQARADGASDELVDEIQRPGPLADIVAGAGDQSERAALYVIAFTVIRADEQVSGSERIFLAQLANLLGLAPEVVASLEQTVAERIDAEA